MTSGFSEFLGAKRKSVPYHEHDASEVTGLGSMTLVGSTIDGIVGGNGALQSPNFVTGVSGWRIAGDGSAEFQSVIVRGTINADDITVGTLSVDRIAAGSITGDKIGDNEITLNLFASSLSPVQVVGSLPLTPPSVEGDMAYLTTDNKLYRHDGVGWIAVIDGADVVGAVATAGGIPTGGALPGTGSAGDLFFLTTDEKLYRHNGTAWILAVDGADVATGTLPADKIIANSITTGQIQAGAIDADRITANSITTTQIQAAGIDADRLVANSITAGQIQAGAISATELSSLFLVVGQVIQSTVYTPGSAGWQIAADGSAEFNNLVVRGDVIASVWDGGSDLSGGVDNTATQGWFLDSSAGAAQFTGDVFLTGNLVASNPGIVQVGEWNTTPRMLMSSASLGLLQYFPATGNPGDLVFTTNQVSLRAPYTGPVTNQGRISVYAGDGATTSGQIVITTGSTPGQTYAIFGGIASYADYIELYTTGDLWLRSNGGTIQIQGPMSGATSFTMGGALSVGSITGTSLSVGSGFISGGSITGTSLGVGTGAITGGAITGSGVVQGVRLLASSGGSSNPVAVGVGNTTTGFANSAGILLAISGGSYITQMGTAFFGPYGDNLYDLGGSGNRWKVIWMVGGTGTPNAVHRDASGRLVVASSSRRFKEDISYDGFAYGTDWIKRLRPITFRWKDREDISTAFEDRWDIGLLAEDVAGLPEDRLVTHDDEGPLSVRYELLTVPLIAAFQELEARVAALESA